MKERPILFNDEMVRAILDGRKTQTRRVLKEPPWATPRTLSVTDDIGVWADDPLSGGSREVHCPYGQPGDRLWVREAWKYANWTEDGEPFIRYRSDGAELIGDFPEDWADRLCDEWALLSEPANYQIDNRAADRKWRPSIHMPRWASRIDLEVVGLRVERVQDLRRCDPLLEGCPSAVAGADGDLEAAYLWFRDLWDSINAKRGYSWDSNLWVWVVEFSRVAT